MQQPTYPTGALLSHLHTQAAAAAAMAVGLLSPRLMRTVHELEAAMPGRRRG